MSLDIAIKVKTKKAGDNVKKFTNRAAGNVKKMESQTVSSAKKMGTAFRNFSSIVGGIGLFALIGGLKKSVTLSNIQEKSYAKLNANLENVLISFKGYERGTESLNVELKRQNQLLIEQSEALQSVTAFGDAQIQSGQAMFATFALTAKEISQLTPRMLDMAAAQEKATGTGVQLEDVAIAIGKALAVNTLGGLRRVGVVMDATTEKMFKAANQTDKLAILTKVLDDNYRGVAEAIGKTNAGKLERVGNIFSDVGESIGRVVLNEKLLNGLERFASGMATLSDLDIPKEIKLKLSIISPFGPDFTEEDIFPEKIFLEKADALFKDFNDRLTKEGQKAAGLFDDFSRRLSDKNEKQDLLNKEKQKVDFLREASKQQIADAEKLRLEIIAGNEAFAVRQEMVADVVERMSVLSDIPPPLITSDEDVARWDAMAEAAGEMPEPLIKASDQTEKMKALTGAIANEIGRAAANSLKLSSGFSTFLRLAGFAIGLFGGGGPGAVAASGFLGSFDHGTNLKFNTGSNGRSKMFAFQAHDGEDVSLNVSRPGDVTNNNTTNNSSPVFNFVGTTVDQFFVNTQLVPMLKIAQSDGNTF